MSDEDFELERLKERRLKEMQKNISQNKPAVKEDPGKNTPPNRRSLILGMLGYRGLEVLENAESQFPHETRMVIDKLAELVESGEITEILDGGKLLTLFRSIGLYVRMDTKINVEKDGKMVSLSDKLSQDSKGDGDEHSL